MVVQWPKKERRGPNVTKTTPSRTLLHWSTLSSCSFMNYFKSGKANWKKKTISSVCFYGVVRKSLATSAAPTRSCHPRRSLREEVDGRGDEKNRNKKTTTRTTRNSISRLHFVPSLDVYIACQPSFQQRFSHTKQVGIQLNVPARPRPTLTRLPSS